MKKQYINILIGLMLIATLFSCHDDLDNYPLDKYSENKVWNTAASAQLFVNGTFYIKDLLLNKSDNMSDDWSDDMVINSQMGTAQNTVRELLTSENNSYGWNKFGDVRRCNLIIQKVSESENMTPPEKIHLIAQAKLLRGIVYFTQARKFGRLILIDKVLSPDDNLMLPRSKTIKETYDFIIQDLKDAAADLPLDAETGALTQGAAYALLAEVALHGAAYLDDASEKESYYQMAKKASEDLFLLSKYSLESDYNKLFNDYQTGLGSKEIILGTYWLSDNTYTSGTWKMKFGPNQGSSNKLPAEVAKVWPLNENYEGWFEKSPSQELINVYQVIDNDGEAKNWDQSSYYLNFRPGTDNVGDAIYKNRDARFYSTVAYDNSEYMNSIVTMRLGGNMYYKNNLEKDQHMTKSGYLYKKGCYLDKAMPIVSNVKMNYHLTPLRLGRSYLNYAEISLRLGDVSTAIEYINKTRENHGQLPSLAAGMSVSDAWDAYKNERRVELVLENDRYWSLLRWGKEDGLTAIPELNITPEVIEISEDGKSFKFIPIPVVASANNRLFTARRYLLPIPKTETILNEALSKDQNPGWE